MNGIELDHWRETVATNLSELKTDVRWIKAHLGKIDVRQGSLERQVAWLKGVGSFVGLVIGSVLALVVNLITR